MAFGEIITYPFAQVLMAFYNWTGSYGFAIIMFALIIKLVLLPFQMKSKRSTMRTARLTPLMKEIEKKCGDNKQKYQEEVAKLYKEEKINPMSGCLWSLIPFPILIALYSVIRQPFTKLMRLTVEELGQISDRLISLGLYEAPARADAYSEIVMANVVHEHFPKFQDISVRLADLDFNFLGVNLGQRPQWNFFLNADWGDAAEWAPALGLFLIPVLSALLSYFAMKVSTATNPAADAQTQQSTKTMGLIMPFISLYIGFVMPAALGIYWIAGSVFGIIQDSILNKHYTKILDAEEAERNERRRLRDDELEKKRLETERQRIAGENEVNRSTSKKKLQTQEKIRNEEKQAAERKLREAESGNEKKDESRVGNRKFARGRAYASDRFEQEQSDTSNEETPEGENENNEG